VARRSDLPDWTDLQFFVELARRETLSATARVLGVTHATVSRHVASLEERLKQSVFERRSGRYVLTEQGEQMLRLAEEMEERALAIARAAAGVEQDVSGTVRITATDAFGAHCLMPHLHDLEQRHPGLQIELLSDQRNLSLARRDADIALRMGPPETLDIVRRKLCDNTYYFYASEHYLRAHEGRELSYIGYDEASVHLPEPNHFAEAASGKRIVFRTNSLNTRLAATRAGIGVALLPRYVAETDACLVRVDLGEAPLRRELWLLVHRELKDVPRVRAARKFLGDRIAAMTDRLG
jgi:DNA-binding transcriptional LysR family regulator